MKALFLTFLNLIFVFQTSCSKNESGNDTDLTGSWIVIEYESISNGQINNGPDRTEDVTITFDDSSFHGNTGRNEFTGNYSVQDDVLISDDFNTTEIAESEWGILFFNFYRDAYSTENNSYTLKFNVSNQVLSFENANAVMRLSKQ